MRGWILPLLIILIVFGVGLWLWCPSNRAPDRYSDLGTAIIGGSVIVLAGLFLERRLSRAAERRDLQLQLGLQNNLVGIDLNRRDLSGFYLSGKDLRYANLTKANLRACLVRVRDKPFCGFRRTRRSYLMALFGRNASKTEETAL